MNGINLTLAELIFLQNYISSNMINTKKNVRSILSGQKVSKLKGKGIDFEEVREYVFGDDIKAIDWNITARTGRVHTKIYKEERERPILLVVDLSSSMRFASKKAFKSIIAAHFATLLAKLATLHKDKVGGVIYSGKNHLELRPKANNPGVQSLIKNLYFLHEEMDLEEDENAMNFSLRRLKNFVYSGSLVIIISDFNKFDNHTQTLCQQIGKHNDIALVFIYDEIEKKAPKSGHYLISNGINNKIFDTTNKNIRKTYEKLFNDKFNFIKKFAYDNKYLFVPLATNDDLIATLNNNFQIFKK